MIVAVLVLAVNSSFYNSTMSNKVAEINLHWMPVEKQDTEDKCIGIYIAIIVF